MQQHRDKPGQSTDCSVFVLTERQSQVLGHAARGLTMAGIAHLLGVSVVTVRKHLRLARQALGAANTTHAVALAVYHRLIQIF